MGTSKNVTWQEYNGTDYDILLPQPSVATADRVGGIIAEEAEVPPFPGFESQYACKISPSTHRLLMPTSITPTILNSEVPISKGGTGADTASKALKNLGVQDYIVGMSSSDDGDYEVFTYKSGRQVLTERHFNSGIIEINASTDDRKWYKTSVNEFIPSVSLGNMNTWKYWNLQAIPIGSKDSMPMFFNLQTGYNPTSNSIPWRLFSTSSLIFNANQLLFLLTVIV